MMNSIHFQPTTKRRHYSPVAITAALLVAGLAPAAWAADPEPAALVAAARGQVTAAGTDGFIRELGLNDPVFAGDIVSTGPNSRVRLQFTDNGLIALRPESRFVIDEYQYAQDPELDRNAFSLVRGGFRAVTGAVGREAPDNYQLETPVATIGIRGTEHTGRFCAGDCFDLADIGVAAPPDGLYTGTLSGRTTVGQLEFQGGEYGYTNPAGVTVPLPEPPPILVADPHLQDIAPDEEEPDEEPPPEETEQPDETAEEPEEEPDEPDEPAEEPDEPDQPAEEPEEPDQPAEPEQPAEPDEAAAPVEEPAEPGAPAEPESPPDASPGPPSPAEPADDLDDGFEIPARPPTVREVDC